MFTGVFVKYAINIYVDNIGSIFLPDNTLVSYHNKHIDTHHHFICDYVEDRELKIQFFRSEENLADPFIKNLRNGTFEFLTARYIHRE